MTKRALMLLAGLLAVGCERRMPTGSVTGTVTFDGKPVENGAVTFMPADGLGQPAGGPITNGKYSIPGVTVGPKVVTLEAGAVVAVSGPQTSEDAYRVAAEAKKHPPSAPPPNLTDAVGNNARVSVSSGVNVIDFPLLSAAKK